ncbi:DUF4224 domain-containing protein [Salmonella enterica]|uniref:DUF4224 domain-containing protein n=1 Tax=Salmonella enterica TaxID=28901 RepID=UPI0003BC76E4|nr:DUF4224 domain-containing protein [Salmonella enterica]AKW15008.1 hypothetical protein SEESL791_007360 [Salmonella enterica subsp. enterica serovar Sloterdijk str. ATCC 15791]
MDNRDQSMTLITDEEMIEITGAQTPSKQCHILRENGIAFVKRLDGRPRTTWFNLNHPLDTRHPQPEKEEMPNFAALDDFPVRSKRGKPRK